MLLFSFLFLCLPLQAKVYWIGRNIEFSSQKKKMTVMGHSYLVILPNNPAKLKQKFPYYAKLEKDLGCGYKGVVIGAYPSGGSENIAHLDGNLVATINATRENLPTRHYLCGKQWEKEQWGFVGASVDTNLLDEDFIINIIKKTLNFQYNSNTNPLDYHALRSVKDALDGINDKANNCNSFAFSLLFYAGATKVLDIGATRSMPGSRRLLPRNYFDCNAKVCDANSSSIEFKDPDYEKRVKSKKDIRELINGLNKVRRIAGGLIMLPVF